MSTQRMATVKRSNEVYVEVDLQSLIDSDGEFAAIDRDRRRDGFRLMNPKRRLKVRKDGSVIVNFRWQKKPAPDLTLNISERVKIQLIGL